MMNPGMMNKLRKMQRELLEAQKKIEATEFVGTAGGGMVKITVLGNKVVQKVEIDREFPDACLDLYHATMMAVMHLESLVFYN